MNLFDICIIHAPNPEKAWDFRQLLQNRLDAGLYPREIDFRVYSDPANGKIGSGGGLISSLFHLTTDFAETNLSNFFHSRKILFINAGGEPLNLPCFAPEAKIFTPLPMETSSLFSPTVLDHHLSLFLKYPWKKGELVMIPADVIVDLDFGSSSGNGGGVKGFAVPVPMEKGRQHGVFVFDAQQKVVIDYFQKPEKHAHLQSALIEGTGQVACDTGILSFSSSVIAALCGFGMQKSGAKFIWEAFQNGELYLDIYSEVLSALILSISKKEYHSRLKGRSSLNQEILTSLFEHIREHHLTGEFYKTTFFHHIGGVPEYIEACKDIVQQGIQPFYENSSGEIKPQYQKNQLIWNSIGGEYYNISAKPVLIEGSQNLKFSNTLGNNLLVGFSNADLQSEIPEGICLENKQIGDENYTIVYSINDVLTIKSSSPKATICGTPIKQWLENRGLVKSDIFDSEDDTIAEAKIFAPNMEEDFLMGFWRIPDDPEWTEIFNSLKRVSIKKLVLQDNAQKRDGNRCKIRGEILKQNIKKGIGWRNINLCDLSNIHCHTKDISHLEKIADDTEEQVLRNLRRNQLDILKDVKENINLYSLSFSCPFNLFNHPYSIGEGKVMTCYAPIRLDLAGGWTDTPPWTQSFGGAVLNISVDLEGHSPIQVLLKRHKKNHIKLHSVDRSQSVSIQDWTGFEALKAPTSEYSLLINALNICGFNESAIKKNVSDWCKEKGGGFELTTISHVPVGAGAGSSSILIAAIIKLFSEVFARKLDVTDVVKATLEVEQQMSISGGWQNPVAGLLGGIKYIKNLSGKELALSIHYLDEFLFKSDNIGQKMTLFYTGIKRKTPKLVFDVAQSFYKKQPAREFTVKYLSRIASFAKNAIEQRNIDALSECLNQTRQLSQNLHPQVMNQELARLLDQTRSFWTGAKPMGAGGGGFILFVSKCANDAENLREFLYKYQNGQNSKIVNFSLNSTGTIVV